MGVDIGFKEDIRRLLKKVELWVTDSTSIDTSCAAYAFNGI